jgi:hypothetical protein
LLDVGLKKKKKNGGGFVSIFIVSLPRVTGMIEKPEKSALIGFIIF